MGIDRIGKGGGPVEPPKTAERPASSGRSFEVKSGERPDAARAVGDVAKITPLDRLRAGEIDLEQYVSIKLDEATAHLHGLAPAQLEHIRKTLRAQMATDPALVDLVRQATGGALAPPEDE